MGQPVTYQLGQIPNMNICKLKISNSKACFTSYPSIAVFPPAPGAGGGQPVDVEANRMAAFVGQVKQNPAVLFENDNDRKFALFCIKEGYSKGSITRLLKFSTTTNFNEISFDNGDQVYKSLGKVPVIVRSLFICF